MGLCYEIRWYLLASLSDTLARFSPKMAKQQNRQLRERIAQQVLSDKDEELIFYAKIIDGGSFSNGTKVTEIISRDTFTNDDENESCKIRVLCISGINSN